MMKKRASAVAVKTVTSRPILLLWSCVSVSVALLCAWSYSQPAWILRPASEIGSLITDTTAAATATAVPSNNRAERSAVVNSPSIKEGEEEEDEEELVVVATHGSGRSAIPLVQIGLFDMCIYSSTPSTLPTAAATSSSSSAAAEFNSSSSQLSGGIVSSVIVTCVPHEALDDEWLPPAWQVLYHLLLNFAHTIKKKTAHQRQTFFNWRFN